jgi:hypothetical protein
LTSGIALWAVIASIVKRHKAGAKDEPAEEKKA